MYNSLSNIQKHLYSLIKQNNPEYLQQSINEEIGVAEAKKEEKWDWRKHSREENKAQGLKVQQERDMKGRVMDDNFVFTRPKAENYYSTISKVSGSPSKHAEVARNKAETNLETGNELDTNDLFYLQKIGKGASKNVTFVDQLGTRFSALSSSGYKKTPKDLELYHLYHSGAKKPSERQSYELPKPTSTNPYADPERFDVSDKKISSMYQITHRYFEKATGERYDARNPAHQKSLLKLNSSYPNNIRYYLKGNSNDDIEQDNSPSDSDNSDKQTLDLTGKSVNSKVSRIA